MTSTYNKTQNILNQAVKVAIMKQVQFRDLFGYIANFVDSETGFTGIVKIMDSHSDENGKVYVRMLSGGTTAAMRGVGELVKLKDLSNFRKPS